MLRTLGSQYYYRILLQKACFISPTRNPIEIVNNIYCGLGSHFRPFHLLASPVSKIVVVPSSTSGGRVRLLSESASAENRTSEKKKDPRYDEDFIDIENTKPYVKNPNIQVTERCENIFKDILKLNSLDVVLLLQLLKERMGMDPYSEGFGGTSFGGKRQDGSAAAGTAEAAEPVAEKTVFELKLTGFDDKSKIKIIKEVRAITGLGLKEAKELVEGVPKIVKKDIKKEEAEELKGKLEAVGAVVEIA